MAKEATSVLYQRLLAKAEDALAELQKRYPRRHCAECGELWDPLDYIAQRGSLQGRMPKRCKACAEAIHQPWGMYNGTYVPAEYQQYKERLVERGRRPANPVKRKKA